MKAQFQRIGPIEIPFKQETILKFELKLGIMLDLIQKSFVMFGPDWKGRYLNSFL